MQIIELNYWHLPFKIDIHYQKIVIFFLLNFFSSLIHFILKIFCIIFFIFCKIISHFLRLYSPLFFINWSMHIHLYIFHSNLHLFHNLLHHPIINASICRNIYYLHLQLKNLTLHISCKIWIRHYNNHINSIINICYNFFWMNRFLHHNNENYKVHMKYMLRLHYHLLYIFILIHTNHNEFISYNPRNY